MKAVVVGEDIEAKHLVKLDRDMLVKWLAGDHPHGIARFRLVRGQVARLGVIGEDCEVLTSHQLEQE